VVLIGWLFLDRCLLIDASSITSDKIETRRLFTRTRARVFVSARCEFIETGAFMETNYQTNRSFFDGRSIEQVIKVELKTNESQAALLKRFQRKVMKSKVLSTVRRKRFFVSKSEARRISKKKAIRNQKKRQRISRDY
jgi:small subunit ribosomal protein S21